MSTHSRARIRKILIFSGKLLIGLIVISPLIYCLLLSFMPQSQINAYPPTLIPQRWTVRNYRKALEIAPLYRYFLNSLILCAIVIVTQVLLSSLAAYAFSFFEFKGKKLLFTLVLATIMIPPETTIISNYLTIHKLNLVDTYLGIAAPYLITGMGVFLMRQFYLTLPKELKEAATIDGCGDIQFLFRVAMPLSMPSIASLSVYTFVLTYNHYFWPLLVTNNDKMRTVQIGISMLKDNEAADYGLVLAGAVMILIPTIVVFIFGQKYVVKGMTAGAVKG